MRKVPVAALVVTLVLVGVMLVSLVVGLETPPAATGREDTDPPEVIQRSDRIRVEVLNAAGRPGIALAATQQLRRHDRLDVVLYGNATEFGRDSSVVIDRVGNPEAARRVAEILGIQDVRSEPDSLLYLDVTVILGAEWEPATEAPS